MTGPIRLRATSGPRGQVLVMALAAMIVLVSLLGLAIDGGRGYWERRQAQNAAEHAALAAAWETCHDTVEHDNWEDAARDAAADNGFVHNGTDVWVTPTNTSGVITVTVRSRLETAFAGLMGFDTIDAEGRAVADCDSTSGQGFAIFAGGHTCDDAGKFLIDISGGDNTVSGRVHSNLNMNVGGSDNDFTGDVTFVTTEQHHPSTLYEPGNPDQTTAEGWPVTFTLAAYRALAEASPTDNLYFVNGDISSSYINSRGDGLYYATGKIDYSDSGPITRNVTLVAERDVLIGGSKLTLNPYPGMNNLLAFSGWDVASGQPDLKKRCSDAGIKLSGGENVWRGFIYAPTSQADLAGSDTSTLIGSIIAWSVKISGQSVNNTADPSFFAGPPVLRLIE